MHASSLKLMGSLLRRHVTEDGTDQFGKIVYDVGSQDVNGTYKETCRDLGLANYVGLDIAPAKNVDVVIPEVGSWLPAVGGKLADVVISGQCVEHVRWPFRWIEQVAEIVRPGGTVIVIAPWSQREHRYPIDCWRILPDGMSSLFEWADLRVIAKGIPPNTIDCFGVGKKPGEVETVTATPATKPTTAT